MDLSELASLVDNAALQSPFPAKTKRVTAEINGLSTEVMSIGFADKIMITVSQDGRLGQWIQVPLEHGDMNGLADQQRAQDEDGLLPLPHLTPRTLLGGAASEREELGQLYAAQIATAISVRNPDERRTVLLGLGLKSATHDRETFIDVLQLIGQCL